MDAITMKDTAVINPDRCIGCGLCVRTCPTGALRIDRKPALQVVIPPETVVDAKLEMAATRGKNPGPVAGAKKNNLFTSRSKKGAVPVKT